MPQSLAAVYLHVVFSTGNRAPLLHDAQLRAAAHAYIAGTLNHIGCTPIIVGGVADHVHMLFRHPRTETIAKVIATVKAASSSWAKTAGARSDFPWQSGYGAFSVGAGELERAIRYIEGQEEHHRKVSFQEEYRLLLQEHGMELDDRYGWD